MTDKHQVGQDLEAWCQRCKLNLDCTVAAVEDGVAQQVQCHTCGNFVPYRPPVDEGVRKDRALKRVLRMRDAKTSRTSSEGQRTSAHADPRWIEVTSGVDSTWAVPYRPERTYDAGDLILHKRFGMGHVERVEKEDEIAVLFRQGVVFLPQNQPSTE